MTRFITILLLAYLVLAPRAAADGLRFDHAIIAVHDFTGAQARMEKRGFAVKPGRLHANGLLNAYLEFDGNTEVELMTVARPPQGSIAQAYYDYLASGEGGIYVALSGIDPAYAATRLEAAGIRYKITNAKAWRYITFPGQPGLQAFFLLSPASNTDGRLRHKNGVTKVRALTVDGNTAAEKMLMILGARACPDTALCYRLANMDLMLRISDPAVKRPSVRRIVFDTAADLPQNISWRAHGVDFEISASSKR